MSDEPDEPDEGSGGCAVRNAHARSGDTTLLIFVALAACLRALRRVRARAEARTVD
jgi:hypothetical protein